MKNLAIIILMLVTSALCFAHASNCWRLETLEREVNSLRRSHYYNETIDSAYWHPKIYNNLPRDEDPDAYHEVVVSAGKHWFPDDWQDRPLK